MRIINLVDSLDKINYGVWNAAISTAEGLYQKHRVKSILIGPKDESFINPEILGLEVYHPAGFSKRYVLKIIEDLNMNPADDIIISHGCWRYPTRWGKRFKEEGYVWIAVPHGMLEPYSMSQKWLLKWMFFNLFEKSALGSATAIRAVSGPEEQRLSQLIAHPNVQFIPNAVPVLSKASLPNFGVEPMRVIYLGRLHKKKNPVKLVLAWMKSKLFNNPRFELILAGPDQGEGKKISNILESSDCENVNYVGPKYGEEKDRLLAATSFFVLPSDSEGLPTSVLEAMQYGCICLISDGCNFPEAIDASVAIRMSTDVDVMAKDLDSLLNMDGEAALTMGGKAQKFVQTNFSSSVVAVEQHRFYAELLKRAL